MLPPIPSPSVGEDLFSSLPDHDFWNAHPRHHLPSTRTPEEGSDKLDRSIKRAAAYQAHHSRSASEPTLPRLEHQLRSTSSRSSLDRKRSRKLPPTLTESLENLALHHTPSRGEGTSPSPVKSSPSVVSSPYMLGLQAFPVPPIPTKDPRRYSLDVAPPLALDMPTPPLTPSYSPAPLLTSSHSSLSQPATSAPSTPSGRPSKMAHILRSPAFTQHASESAFFRPSVSDSFNSLASPVTCSSDSASTCGSWSVLDEPAPAAVRIRENRKQRKERKKVEAEVFDVDTPPTMRQLYQASLLELVDDKGERVKFGDLVRTRRTIVVFIRHWFCPLCAQYMNSILAEVSLDALERADVDLIIIGNGSSKMLNGYKNKAFKCPFKMYTDPTLMLYRTLGLTRQTGDSGPDDDAGAYLVQTALESTVQTIKRATQMPLRNPGHFLQLGGEFIFESPHSVSYTHRMTTTRSHAPIREICFKAGVRLEFIHYEPGPPPPPVHRSSYDGLGNGERDGRDEWKDERDKTLGKIRRMKERRREGFGLARRREVKVVGEDDEVEGVADELEGLGIAL